MEEGATSKEKAGHTEEDRMVLIIIIITLRRKGVTTRYVQQQVVVLPHELCKLRKCIFSGRIGDGGVILYIALLYILGEGGGGGIH